MWFQLCRSGALSDSPTYLVANWAATYHIHCTERKMWHHKGRGSKWKIARDPCWRIPCETSSWWSISCNRSIAECLWIYIPLSMPVSMLELVTTSRDALSIGWWVSTENDHTRVFAKTNMPTQKICHHLKSEFHFKGSLLGNLTTPQIFHTTFTKIYKPWAILKIKPPQK